MIKVDVSALKLAVYCQGMNFNSFAKKLGRSKSLFNNIVKRKTISAELAKQICDELKVNFDALFEVV